MKKEEIYWEDLMQEIADTFNIPVIVKTEDRCDFYKPRKKGGQK